MLVREASFAAIDFESAGAAPGGTDAPVQIGLAVMQGGLVAPEWQFASYLHTDQPIIWTAQRVHGITLGQLAHAPRLVELWPRLNATLRSRLVVAHGAGTEKRFLRAFPLHGFGPWIDSLKVAQAALPDLPDHSLESVAAALNATPKIQQLCPERRFHDALFDAVASLVVVWEIIERAGLHDVEVDALIQPQRSGYFARRRERR